MTKFKTKIVQRFVGDYEYHELLLPNGKSVASGSLRHCWDERERWEQKLEVRAARKSNVFDPRSASNRYVIYDQFHWASNDHFVETVIGWEAALERYRWWKEMKGDSVVLGLATKEYFDHLMDSYK